jgi:phage terminase large subunit-like protein
MATDALRFVRDQIVLPTGVTVGQALAADPWIEREILKPVFARNDKNLPLHRLCYFELARGHAKSLYAAAIALCEALLHRSTDVIIAAGDKDQAGIVMDHLRGFVERNPVLRKGLSLSRDELRIGDSRIRVIPSDAATAWGHGGIKQRFRIVVDELTAWPTNGEAFWVALASATGKVADSQTIVLSNAGYGRGESWQWKVRETAETKSWAHLYSADGVIASWIDADWLEQQRDLLPASAYERVILNRWVAETGDFVTREQFRRCVEPGLKPQPQGVREIHYYGGLDLGLVKDATAFAVVHVDGQRIILDELQTWQGSHKNPLQVETVVRAVTNAKQRFEKLHIVADPWQLADPIQRLRSTGVPVTEFNFSSGSLAHLSTTLYAEITSANLRVFEDQALESEILGLVVVQTPSGWKVDHRAGGYSDRAIAIGMALTKAVKYRKKPGSESFWEREELRSPALSRGIMKRVF